MLKFNDDALKNINLLAVDCLVIQQVGSVIFNNLGTQTPEFSELCAKLEKACDSIITETQKLRAYIPVE